VRFGLVLRVEHSPTVRFVLTEEGTHDGDIWTCPEGGTQSDCEIWSSPEGGIQHNGQICSCPEGGTQSDGEIWSS